MPRKLGKPKNRQPKQELEPWDVPPIPPPETHDTDAAKLYEAVGRALTIWERSVEGHLAGLFSVIIGTGTTSDAAMRAYGAIQTFRGRSEMLVAAAEVYFKNHPDSSLTKHFDDAIELASNFSPRRNDIAHGCVTSVSHSPIKYPRWLLLPPRHSTAKITSSGIITYGYTSAIIKGFADHFSNVGVSINQVISLVAARHDVPHPFGERPALPFGEKRGRP
jgi:hypothetical protein